MIRMSCLMRNILDAIEEEAEEEKKNIEPVVDDENEEEEDQVFDFEFDMVLDQNKEAMKEAGIDINVSFFGRILLNFDQEFYQQDTETQYKVVKKFRNRMQSRKIKKYLAVNNY